MEMETSTHLLCVLVFVICPSQFPLLAAGTSRCPPVLSSPRARGLISEMLQGPGRLVQRRLLLSCFCCRLVVLPMVNVGRLWRGLRDLAAEERLAQRY
jgi:hypothetical protein